MVLCETCSLKLVRKMTVALNALFKIPMMILRNKMSALVTMSNVWNSDGDKECVATAVVTALIYREKCVTLVYILSIWRAPEFFTPEGTTLRQ